MIRSRKAPSVARGSKNDRLAYSACAGIKYRLAHETAPRANLPTLGDNLPNAWPYVLAVLASAGGIAIALTLS